MGLRQRQLFSWLPQLNPQMWILAFSRFLSQTGTGLTLFYGSIFFVNQLGLSATAVGISIAISQFSGIFGRIFGGSFSDSPQLGKRKTLILSALISAIASLILATAQNLTTVILGHLFLGLGIGLYWPATEAIIADVVPNQQRSEAYAISRLADNLGLQLGIIIAGIIITQTEGYRLLFLIDAVSFILYAGVIYGFIQESYPLKKSDLSIHDSNLSQRWKAALSDRFLLTYVGVNILFTLYISQIHTTLPLYLSNIVKPSLSATTISGLFTWHIAVSVLFQLPVTRLLNRWNHIQALMISAGIWGIGFIFILLTGMTGSHPLFYGIVGLGILAIATISYTPFASALISEIAPNSLLGTYQAIHAQCWAIGYLIGPPLGGWALDQSPQIMYNFWMILSGSVILGILVLLTLNKQLKQNQKKLLNF